MTQPFAPRSTAFVPLDFHFQESYDTNSYSAGKGKDSLAMIADILYQV